jgi:hypothetical protein
MLTNMLTLFSERTTGGFVEHLPEKKAKDAGKGNSLGAET